MREVRLGMFGILLAGAVTGCVYMFEPSPIGERWKQKEQLDAAIAKNRGERGVTQPTSVPAQ